MNNFNFTNKNLIEVTSQRQKKNGTRQFFDLEHRVHYISTATGYVRREIRDSDKSYSYVRYPLNRKNNVFQPIFSEVGRLLFIDHYSKKFNKIYFNGQ